MRVYIPTHDRADRIRTPWAWPDMDYIVVCHSASARRAYLRTQLMLDPERVVVSDVDADDIGLVRQRRWIVDTYAQPGEWVFMADDNIGQFVGVPPALADRAWLPTHDRRYDVVAAFGASTWVDLYRVPYNGAMMADALAVMVPYANALGAWLCGFGTTPNPWFRDKHWRRVGYVSGKAILWRHDPDYPWDTIVHMEDFHHSAEHHVQHGRVLVNNWVYPSAKHYEPGGMGPYADRIRQRRASVYALLQRYPGLLRSKQRPGFEPDTELAFRLTTTQQVDAWRSRMMTA